MILVVSHAGDGHLPAVCAKLDQAGAPWFLLDTDEYPERLTIADGPLGCTLDANGRRVALSDVKAVWWRRPQPPVISERPADIARWAERQAFAALDSALNSIDALWVNHPRCNRGAEDKPANLRRAAALGLDVPAWCVTNDPVVARAFAGEHEAVVVKAVESAYVARKTSMWTRRLDDLAWLDRMGPEPYLLQQFIDKEEDLRVTVVGEEIFAVAIDSQGAPQTSVDMRAGDLRALPHRAVELPTHVCRSLLALCASLKLRFAAIDLVRARDGRYWFLEVNPNGQWAWLEELSGVSIGDALVGLLTSSTEQPAPTRETAAAPSSLPGSRGDVAETRETRGRWPVRLWVRIGTLLTPDPEQDPDNRFSFTQAELVARLHTDDAEIAQEILLEAQQIAERMVEGRTESVERRAATLQSATAIAGSFSLAGGTLLVTRVHGLPWQTLMGLLLLWVTANLGLCGWRATQAASTIHRWSVVRNAGVLERSNQTLAEARIERAAQVLRAAGWNARYARFKVTMFRRAGRHLSRATLGLPVLVAAVVVYALCH